MKFFRFEIQNSGFNIRVLQVIELAFVVFAFQTNSCMLLKIIITAEVVFLKQFKNRFTADAAKMLVLNNQIFIFTLLTAVMT